MKVTLASLAKHNYWYEKEPNSTIDVICLLWNGMFIKLSNIRADLPLEKIKEDLWSQRGKHSKEPKENYVFVVVSNNHGTEELVDEKLSLFDVKPVKPYLKVTRKQGNEEIKKIKSKISMLIGHNISACNQEEVKEAQKNLSDMCNRISIERGKSSWYRRAIYTYPPDFEEDSKLPRFLEEKFPNKRIHISVSVLKNSSNVFDVEYSIKPLELIEKALRKRAQTLRVDYKDDPDQYMLKVLGSESYFLGNIVFENDQECYKEIPLIQYKYIREALYWDRRPSLIVMKREDMDICKLSSTNQDYPPALLPKNRQSKRNKFINLWDLSPKTMFKVKIKSALDLNSGKLWEKVQCGIFHGGDEVCETRSTSRIQGSSPVWNEFLNFDLPVCDIPRMARLCFCIVGYENKKKGQAVPLAWVNMPLFNYKGFLHTGSFRIYCWQHSKKSNRTAANLTFNPLGTVMNSNESGPCLAFELTEHDGKRPVVYPSEEDVYEKAANDITKGTQESDGENILLVKGGKQHKEQIEDIIKRDSLAPMFEQDKELLWRLRAECCLEYPESLPKLLQCVKWNNKEQVAQIHFLLQSWNCRTLEVEIALELLDYKFPDLKVRQRAVEVLNNISDNQLEMYLLHLVQALKYESYLDSPLARYLLKRALNNRRIGHYLFWHLKADVGNTEHSLQFGLLLELYCFGAVEHIDSLYKQVELMKKLKTVSSILIDIKEDKDKIDRMKDCFKGFSRFFQDLVSPLDPRYRLKQLRVEKCNMMSSKKKPFWLVFENFDDKADDIFIIFKSGDDLRQDMLTLLSLQLMDSVWKSAGLDYGIIPYRCLSTGPSIGLIQVVTNSKTIASIQSKSGVIRGALSASVLYNWLEANSTKVTNTDQVSPLTGEQKLELLTRNFTRSLVGYSVGMYVLGVGDRHNDNIMMKEDTGQLFHIDFGHFLGNFKTKFGIQRERAKFVLTSDMCYVIAKDGADDASSRFKSMCLEAFSCLRERGNLFITVFAMLLSSGLPELRRPTDIDYLRDSLALLKDEADAQKHFIEIFEEALNKGGWTTIQFLIHNIRHHRN